MQSKLKKLLLIIIVVIIIVIGFFLISKISKKEKSQIAQLETSENHCPTQSRKRVKVEGDSLIPILYPDTDITVILNYYDCNDIKRDDIIAYDYAARSEPIIKIIKAIPGDSFGFKKVGLKNEWNIQVNNDIIKNSEGTPYVLAKPNYDLLNLYVKDYNGIIPTGSYLILGNLPQGSLDSTRFGLVHKDDILGKVIK